MSYIKSKDVLVGTDANYDIAIDTSYVIDFDILDDMSIKSPIKYKYVKKMLDTWIDFINNNYCLDFMYIDSDGLSKTKFNSSEIATVYQTLLIEEILKCPKANKRKKANKIINGES